MTELRRIVALAGLSGAGKTTLIKNVIEDMGFTHLSASSLIKEYKNLTDSSASSEQLRAGDIQNNQDQLVQAFKARSETIRGDIILDCHTLIDTPSGLQLVPIETFSGIGITELVFLTVSPDDLVARRTADSARVRPERSPSELQDQQVAARTLGLKITESLKIPFYEISQNPSDELESILRSDLHVRSNSSPP